MRVSGTASFPASAGGDDDDLRLQQRDFVTRPWWKPWGHENRGQEEAKVGPTTTPIAAAHRRELHAVNTAVTVNGVIMVAKAVTWWMTGSGALLAETLHSLADVMNQVLLRMGIVKSRKAPTTLHPYGFHREKYIYALMSAVSIFCLGAGASLLHGVQALFEPPHLQDMAYSLMVLGGSSVLEIYSLRVAAKSMADGAVAQGHSMRGWKDWVGYIMRGRDPTTAAVLAEDVGAVAGLGIAGLFTSLTWITGNPVYDAIGSMAVGALMGGIAMMLIRNNKQFLIGRSMRSADHQRIVDHLLRDPMVLAVLDAKSEELGDGVYRFKAEIQWSGEKVVEKYLRSQGRSSVYRNLRSVVCRPEASVEEGVLQDAMDMAMMEFGRGVIRTVGEEIDRLETEMKEMVPGLRYVDLETDKGKANATKLMSAMGASD